MKYLIIFMILLSLCCLQANSQDYLKLANECFEKGDYECAKRNYTFFQNFDGRDMSAQIQKADDCYKELIIADAFYKEKDFEKARDRYKTVLENNSNDTYAKKQYDLCIIEFNRLTSDSTVSQIPSNNNTTNSFTDFTETTNQLNIEMIAIQGGSFIMGCTSEQVGDCDNDEKPIHQVTVSDFYIGKYEVTQAQWKVVMGKNSSDNKGDSLPVENVTWKEVQEFIRRLNDQTGKQYRLPTEAEWEYTARGGRNSKGYKYSGSNDLDNVAWYSRRKTNIVGSKSPNELGIYDLSGNVWEWCSDWYGSYSVNAQTLMNPTGPSNGSYRVARGGSWFSYAIRTRVSFRNKYWPSYSAYDLGFRLACSSN